MKTFLLMLGSAFMGVVLFVAAVYGYFYWQYALGDRSGPVSFPPRSETTVGAVPPIAEEERFYGVQASMIGKFPQSARQTVLAAGEGRIEGTVKSSGKPVQGLKLRLGLNGSVMSQWVETDRDGRYAVPVPFGKYRVDGYELDHSSAERALKGKTDSPSQLPFHREIVMVAPGKPAPGLDLEFVDPVRKLGPFGEFRLGEPLAASWEPYPGAIAYRLQLEEWRDREDYGTHRQVFEWDARPIVHGTQTDLMALGAQVNKGHYYALTVEALGERNKPISVSARHFNRTDFRVLE